ncbi:hypothetical protein Tco_0287698 [Tanacetum coccineum]
MAYSSSSLSEVELSLSLDSFLAFKVSISSSSDSDVKSFNSSIAVTFARQFRWRSRVASRSSSPTTSTPEIPNAPIPPAPSAVDIPIGRLYRTHPGGPCRALTARKSVRPLPSHRLALRYISHHLDRFTSGSSSDHSSSGHSILGHSLSGHTPPDTTIADSSAPSRLVYPPLARTPQYSEAYCRWRSAPLSTMYPPMTSKSSAGDSSSESSAGPSRKRCRSPAGTVTSFIHTLRALVPSRADVLPPPKRFRDFISPKDSVEEDINTDVLADIEADATTVEVAADMNVEAGVDAGIGIEVDVRIDVEDEVEGEVDSSDRGTMEVGVDVVAGLISLMICLCPMLVEDIKTGQRELEVRSLIASRERDGLLDRVASLERSNARLQGTLMMESARADRFRRCIGFMKTKLRQIRMFCYYDRMRFRRLETFVALAAYEANRAAEFAVESQSQNRDDDDNGNVGGNGNGNGEGNGDGNGGGNGNGNKGGNGNGNPNRKDRGVMPVAHKCTYHDFVKCQPLNFKGTKGVIGLTRWFEKMERVFHISNYPERYQVNYATCTLLNSALTWWNVHKRNVGADAAFTMS